MQIHVVKAKETVASIAAAYNVQPRVIIEANELPNPDNLVIGQALVIPIEGSFYWVRPGDSLWLIGKKVGIAYQEIAKVNRISIHQPLSVGMRLYIPPKAKSKREFNAYVEPRGKAVSPALTESARKAAPYLTYLSPFAYLANREGKLSPPPLGDFPQIAGSSRSVLAMVVANQEKGRFSEELGHILLTDTKIQNALLDNIVAEVKRIGFGDVHFDFEYLLPEDKDAYTSFLKKARDRLHKEGVLISAALAPKTSAGQTGQWYEAHDYKAQGEIVDYLVIMTYEWGYSGGPPMPVSPIPSVRQVLEYAVQEIPPNKILMGQNLYGYDWTLPYKKGTAAKAVSPQQAIEIAASQGVPIQYDETAQAPYIDYTSDGKEHKVWFEDARSIQAKFDLVKELNLRGVSYWKLGLSFPQNWLLIADNFIVEKKKNNT